MKTILRLLALAVFACAIPTLQTGCGNIRTTQNVAVQTLKSVGQIAEEAMVRTIHLWDERKITAEQTNRVRKLYNEFQVAFRFAKDAVRGDVSQVAPQDLVAMSLELAKLVSKL